MLGNGGGLELLIRPRYRPPVLLILRIFILILIEPLIYTVSLKFTILIDLYETEVSDTMKSYTAFSKVFCMVR